MDKEVVKVIVNVALVLIEGAATIIASEVKKTGSGIDFSNMTW